MRKSSRFAIQPGLEALDQRIAPSSVGDIAVPTGTAPADTSGPHSDIKVVPPSGGGSSPTSG